MKKLLKVILCSIICYLCIVSYGITKAENENQTETNNTIENTSHETNSEEKKENNETSGSAEGQNTSADDKKNEQSSKTSGSSTDTKKTTQSAPKAEAKKSTNANLSDLGITPNDFKGFSPTTLNYAVTVPNNVDKVSVYAKVQD